jgi:hypothetical protein
MRINIAKVLGLVALMLLSAALAQNCPSCSSHSFPRASDNSISTDALNQSFKSSFSDKSSVVSAWEKSSQDCGVCEKHSASIVDLVSCSATDATNKSVSLHSAKETVNYTYCGCPDLINIAVVNSTDILDSQVGPMATSEKVNFTYNATFNASKTASVVYNLTELGDKLVLLEYNITVENAGNVNITAVEVNDSLLGVYSLGKLIPGQSAIIRPRYTVNKSQIRYCFVNNTANITGTDRCCAAVNLSVNNSFSINLEELEDILHQYNATIENLTVELKMNANLNDIEKLEGILRNQSNRIITFEGLLHDAWNYIPG